MYVSWKLRVAALLVAGLSAVSCGVKVHPYPPIEGTNPGAAPVPVSPPAANPSPVTPTNDGAGGAGGAGGAPGGGAVDPASGGVPPVDAAPAASPQEGVMIGGRFVPRNKAIVFIHVGHSDMAGRASGPQELHPYMFDTHPQLWVYQRGGTFRPAREPTAGDESSVNRSGPGMSILRNALLRAPDAQIISIGHGHSGSTLGFCPNFRKGKPLYPEFMNEALELKGKVTFGAVFVMFGITEYHTGTQGLATTGDCIFGLINDVRADLEISDLPLMVSDWNAGGSGIYSPTGEYGRVVQPQLVMLPSRDPRTALIPTVGLPMQDDRHLDMAGQKLWGERAFAIMSARGFIPWATVP